MVCLGDRDFRSHRQPCLRLDYGSAIGSDESGSVAVAVRRLWVIYYLDSTLEEAKWRTSEEKTLFANNLTAEDQHKTEHKLKDAFTSGKVWASAWHMLSVSALTELTALSVFATNPLCTFHRQPSHAVNEPMMVCLPQIAIKANSR